MSTQTEKAALKTIKDALADVDRWLNDAEARGSVGGVEGGDSPVGQRMYWQGAGDAYSIMRTRLQNALRELEAPSGPQSPQRRHTTYSASTGL